MCTLVLSTILLCFPCLLLPTSVCSSLHLRSVPCVHVLCPSLVRGCVFWLRPLTTVTIKIIGDIAKVAFLYRISLKPAIFRLLSYSDYIPCVTGFIPDSLFVSAPRHNTITLVFRFLFNRFIITLLAFMIGNLIRRHTMDFRFELLSGIYLRTSLLSIINFVFLLSLIRILTRFSGICFHFSRCYFQLRKHLD